MDQPSKLIGMYTKANCRPTSSLVNVYSDVPVDTNTNSLQEENETDKKNIIINGAK